MSQSFPLPDDNLAYRFPVSVKGVVLRQSKVALLRNHREEWELPGGKLELGETPETCLVREIGEELNLHVETGPLIDAWVYHIDAGIDVLIITYGCYHGSLNELTPSSEHKEAAFIALDELESLRIPDGYKRSIGSWVRWLEERPGREDVPSRGHR